MNDDDHSLREKARELIQAGKLPSRAPDSLFGGPGTGAKCAICGASTNQSEMELEIEFDDPRSSNSDTYVVHQRCFSVLELELRTVTPGATSAQKRFS